MTDSSLPNHPQPKDSFSELVDTILEQLTFEVIKWNYGASSAECAVERLKAKAKLTQIHNDLLVEAEKRGFDMGWKACGEEAITELKAQTKGEE